MFEKSFIYSLSWKTFSFISIFLPQFPFNFRILSVLNETSFTKTEQTYSLLIFQFCYKIPIQAKLAECKLNPYHLHILFLLFGTMYSIKNNIQSTFKGCCLELIAFVLF